MMRLEGKVAVVTGANSGIGRQTARTFVQEGAKVVGVDIRTDVMAEFEKEAAAWGGEFSYLECDVCNFESVQHVFEYTLGKYGRVDVMSNNAGISTNLPITRIPDEVYDRIMNINLKGTYYFCKCSASAMKRQDPMGGVIVNMASVNGIYGSPMGCPYATSKGGVIALTKSLAQELARFKIRVNCVAPGVINTNMMQGLNEASKATFDNTIPLGRLGEAEDVANAVLFLSTDEANYITGACLNVDGGYKP